MDQLILLWIGQGTFYETPCTVGVVYTFTYMEMPCNGKKVDGEKSVGANNKLRESESLTR